MKNKVVKRLLAGMMCGVMACSMGSNICVQVQAEEKEAEENVTVEITSIAFDVTETSIKTGETLQLTATVTPEDATNQTLLYISSNPLAASVDMTGKVTAMMEGTTTITAIALDGSEKYASCEVTVTNAKDDNNADSDNNNSNDNKNDDEKDWENYTGLAYVDGSWKYYEEGKLNKEKCGFVEFGGTKFLVIGGTIATEVDGLVQDPEHREVWYYLAGGRVQTEYTGLAEYDGEWFYISLGELDTTRAGYVVYDTGLFFVGAGRIMREVNGLAQDPESRKWYYLANGQAQTDYTGLAMYDNAWFYVENGMLAEDYTGEVEYDGATFYVRNGMLSE